MAGTITDRLVGLFTRYGDCLAVQFENLLWTWGDVATIDAAIEGLRAVGGIGVEAPVAVVLRDRPEILAAVFGALAHRRTAELFSPLLPDADLARALADCPAPVVVAADRDWERLGLHDAVAGRLAIAVRPDGTSARQGEGDIRADCHADGTPNDVAMTVLTSGTTGSQKRIPLPYGVLDAMGANGRVPDPNAARGATINALPLVSVGGALGVASTVWRGRPLALMERFDVATWAALVRQHRPRRAGGPPAVLRMILDAGLPADDLRSVTCFETGSAPVDPSLAAEFEARYGIPVLVSYGATEFLAAVTGWTIDDWKVWAGPKRGSVGRPIAGFRVRVVDQAGATLATDEPGRLEVQPPSRPGLESAGWVATNDRARIDGDGFVWILGRFDDVVIRGGFKIDLGDVQRVLEQHPAVAEVAVVGIADGRLGTVPAALVVPAAGATIDPGELRDWSRTRLAPYQVPARIAFTDALPRNAMLKVAAAEVRRRLKLAVTAEAGT